MVSIVNSSGLHRLHLWTQGLAKRGLFAIGSWNGGPDAVVPYNGTKGILGTNPFTYGFPSDQGEVVVDMASSEIPYFKITGAVSKGTELPANTAVDSAGEVTTDCGKAFDDEGVSNLLPMGGHNYKGYNFNYLLEIMTSALVGAKSSAEMSSEYVEIEHGGFLIAIAIDQVTNPDTYKDSVTAMNQKIRKQTPRENIPKVQVPGDMNFARYSGLSMESEIDLADDYLKQLKEL